MEGRGGVYPCRGARHGWLEQVSNGERSSVGRAPDCDSGGRGFESRRSPHLIRDLGSRSYPLQGFCRIKMCGLGVMERREKFTGPLAQPAEQGTLNPKVEGSIPSRPTTYTLQDVPRPPISLLKPAYSSKRTSNQYLWGRLSRMARRRLLRGPRQLEQVSRSIELNVLPALGDRPIAEITAGKILVELRKIESAERRK
jgi:hypothetical protein